MNPYVRWDAARGIWRMWYAAGETYEPNVICYAESADGLEWRKFEGNPVFAHGPRDSWDCDRVGGCRYSIPPTVSMPSEMRHMSRLPNHLTVSTNGD